MYELPSSAALKMVGALSYVDHRRSLLICDCIVDRSRLTRRRQTVSYIPVTEATCQHLEIICGCMFSGKTTLLIERAGELRRLTGQVLCFKPVIDNRYSTSDIVSHDGGRLKARAVERAIDISQLVGAAQAVAIDEVHFFDESIISVCCDLATDGRHVVCSGLDRDMWGDTFDHVQRLFEMGRATRLQGICKACGRPADRTQRTVPLVDCNLVGGAGEFEPRCQQCFTPPPEPKPSGSPKGIA